MTGPVSLSGKGFVEPPIEGRFARRVAAGVCAPPTCQNPSMTNSRFSSTGRAENTGQLARPTTNRRDPNGNAKRQLVR
jgi:hypothetical protein